jgi:hypothetical protein
MIFFVHPGIVQKTSSMREAKRIDELVFRTIFPTYTWMNKKKKKNYKLHLLSFNYVSKK